MNSSIFGVILFPFLKNPILSFLKLSAEIINIEGLFEDEL
jgi:hypothetical protein